MIITLKKDASAAETRKIVSQIEEKGLSVTVIEGANYNVLRRGGRHHGPGRPQADPRRTLPWINVQRGVRAL